MIEPRVKKTLLTPFQSTVDSESKPAIYLLYDLEKRFCSLGPLHLQRRQLRHTNLVSNSHLCWQSRLLQPGPRPGIACHRLWLLNKMRLIKNSFHSLCLQGNMKTCSLECGFKDPEGLAHRKINSLSQLHNTIGSNNLCLVVQAYNHSVLRS